MSNELQKTYTAFEDAWYDLSDIRYYMKYMPEDYYKDILEICIKIKSFRKKCIDTMDTPLIALKNYTEHKCSWERAGMMCDLHIFGLREYCKEKNVDWGGLRIDEYYGVEGEEGITEIKNNWKKLDPEKRFEPIKYGGDSLYTKYSISDNSLGEDCFNDATKNYINYKSKMLISRYACELYKTLKEFLENNPEYENEISFYKKNSMNKDLEQFSKGVEIQNEEDLDYLEHTLRICESLLKNGLENNDLESILNSYYKLKDILVDEYYCYKINRIKNPTQEK